MQQLSPLIQWGWKRKNLRASKEKKNSWRCLIDLRFSDKRSWFKTMVVGVPMLGPPIFPQATTFDVTKDNRHDLT